LPLRVRQQAGVAGAVAHSLLSSLAECTGCRRVHGLSAWRGRALDARSCARGLAWAAWKCGWRIRMSSPTLARAPRYEGIAPGQDHSARVVLVSRDLLARRRASVTARYAHACRMR